MLPLYEGCSVFSHLYRLNDEKQAVIFSAIDLLSGASSSLFIFYDILHFSCSYHHLLDMLCSVSPVNGTDYTYIGAIYSLTILKCLSSAFGFFYGFMKSYFPECWSFFRSFFSFESIWS